MPHETPRREDPSTALTVAMRRQRALRHAVHDAPFERLERRQLMSATLQDGVLSVATSNDDAVVSFEQDGGSLNVNENGTETSFVLTRVRRIVVTTGSGNDTIDASGVTVPVRVLSGAGNDWVRTGSANDDIYGGDGDDTLIGGAGDDSVRGEAGNDFINGEAGRDFIWGNGGNDTLLGGAGDDLIRGEAGDDQVWGGADNDTLLGHAGHDVLRGGDGRDVINGYDGNDSLFGNGGSDVLNGGAGNDALDSGASRSLVFGSAGADQFVRHGSNSVIVDYRSGEDQFVSSISGGGDLAEPANPAKPEAPKPPSKPPTPPSNDNGGGEEVNDGTDDGDLSDDRLNDPLQPPADRDDVNDGGNDGSNDDKDGGNTPDDPAREGTLIRPGNGFSGPTGPYGKIGTGQHSDAKAIARWDVVPFQSFDGDFEVGVLAFHVAGIDRVEFTVNGGETISVREPSLNPRTGVEEYWVKVRATDYADDEQIEIRAVAFPVKGEPRVLQGAADGSQRFQNGNHSMFLTADHVETDPIVYASGNGSDSTGNGTKANPYRSPGKALMEVSRQYGSADGATVYLMPGEYTWGGTSWPYVKTNETYATIEAAPGVNRSQVVFNEDQIGGFRTKLLQVRNVTIDGIHLKGNAGEFLWVDDSRMYGKGRAINGGFFSSAWRAGTYFTDVEASHNRNGLRGATFTRGANIHTVSGVAFGESTFVVDSRAWGYDNSGTNFHGDVFHWFFGNDDVENVLIYDVDASDFDDQGIFAEVHKVDGKVVGDRIDNVAIVNLSISKNAVSGSGSWWEVNTDHLLLQNVNLTDQVLRWAQEAYNTKLTNVGLLTGKYWAMSGTHLPVDTLVIDVEILNSGYYGGWTP